MQTPLARDIIGTDDRLIMIVGGFGSGKTEVSVNLALRLAGEGRRVQIADLDIANPYFRCREARELMRRQGIRVVVPPGSRVWADLPIVLPEIRGMLDPPRGMLSIFDVGGDDVGARALGAYRNALADGDYEMWQVLNPNRPFTNTIEGCLEMRRELEAASRFKVTGFLANPHLIDETDIANVLAGLQLTRDVSRAAGIPLRGLTIMQNLAGAPELSTIDVPLLTMRRRMLPPWLCEDTAVFEETETERLPAARPVPLGRPRSVPDPRTR